MFTNNYIAFRWNMFFGNVSGTFKGLNYKSIKSAGNEAITLYSGVNNNHEADIGRSMGYGRCRALTISGTSTASNTYYGVYFGTGTTAATKLDYTLESPITSGLTISSPSSIINKNDGNGVYSLEAPFVLTNTTATEINISEIGCFTPVQTESSTYHAVLMERTVLDEPVTIASGETKLITYKITFNQP